MRAVTCHPRDALGAITRANHSDAAGHRLIAKGRVVTPYDIERLAAAGITSIDVVFLDVDDIDENQAASMLAARVASTNTRLQSALHGRVDLTATCAGILLVDQDALAAANANPALTLATLLDGTVTTADMRIASVKVMPLAIHQSHMPVVAAPVVSVRPFVRNRIGVLIVGAPATHDRLRAAHLPPLTERLNRYAAAVTAELTATNDAAAVADTIRTLSAHVDVVITVSETSVMGLDDPLPTGIMAAGGHIIRHGAPVEPGNLMLLAVHGAVPVFAAPGCVRQRNRNLIDLLLPRLIADLIPTSADIAGWAYGGLLGGNDD